MRQAMLRRMFPVFLFSAAGEGAGGGGAAPNPPAPPAAPNPPTPPAPPVAPATPPALPAAPPAPPAPPPNPADDAKVQELIAAKLAEEKKKWETAAAREAERAKADDLKKAQMDLEDRQRALAEAETKAQAYQSELALYRHLATTGEHLQPAADKLLQPLIAQQMATPGTTAETAIANIRAAYPYLFQGAAAPATPAAPPAPPAAPPAAPAAPPATPPAQPGAAGATTTPLPAGAGAGGSGSKNMLEASDADLNARLQQLGIRPPGPRYS